MFENGVLKRTFGPKKDEVRVYRRHLGGHGYNILVRKVEGESSLGTHKHRWESNIKMGLKGRIEKVYLAQGRNQWWDLVSMVTNLWVPLVLEIS